MVYFIGTIYTYGRGYCCQGFGLVLSMAGLTHYDAALTAAGISGDSVFAHAVLPLPFSVSMSFAATTIRAYIGLQETFGLPQSDG